MKKSLIILFSIFLGCTSKKNEVKSIELMAYNYEIENSKRVLNSFLYSSLDTIGNAKNLRKTDSIDVVGYNFQIDPNLMSKILNLTRNKEETYFIRKFDSLEIGCYLGPIIRFRILYSNGKEISFHYQDREYDKESKYYLFKLLYNQLLSNPKTEVYKKTALDLISFKENKFKTFAFHKDTLDFPMPPTPPPTPKIDEVKFVK